MIRGKIDPGHVEGYNRGTCSNYYEGTQMYKLAVYEVEESKKYEGLEVSITRGLRENPSLYERAKQAQGFDFMLSEHSNANSRSDSNGVHIYRSLKRPDDALAIALGKVIASTMGAPFKILTRADSKGNDYYGILRNPVNLSVKMPLLIEHGYHTNDKQCEWLLNDSNLKLLAERKMRVIADYYGCNLKNAPVYYSLGDTGDDVKKLQADLTRIGFNPPGGIDGSFGPGMVATIKSFQINFNLMVDGIAGPQTLAKIAQLVEQRETQERLKAEAEAKEAARKTAEAEALKNKTIAPDGKYYRVISQFGVFKVKEGAEQTKIEIEELLKAKGIKVNDQDPIVKIILE